jgi:PrcB C-terminal
MIKLRLVSAISLTLVMTGCGGDGSSSDEPIINTFDAITCPAVASYSSITKSNLELITNSPRFVELYRGSDLYSQQAQPIVDFDKKSVLAIHLGEKPSSGHQVKITSLEDKDSKVIVNYDVISPSEGCAVDASLTYPYCFVSIQKSTKPVEFNATKIAKCTN